MEKILAEILAELQSLNQKIGNLSEGNSIYDVCYKLEDISINIEKLNK